MVNRIKKNRPGWLIILAIILVTFFFLVALLRIGVGKAEWAGMTVSNLNNNLAIEYNIPDNEKGVVVLWVEEQAYYSNVKEGDLLKAINNQKVKNVSDFLRVAKNINIDNGVLLDLKRDQQPMFITLKNKLGMHGQIKELFHAGSSASEAFNQNQAMTQVALTAPVADVYGHLPTPKEQRASKKILVEGHWLGMELISLTPELAKEYRVPPDTKGLLVDEVSLEAAECGLLAGDMVLAVDKISTPDLVAFTDATRRVKNKNQAEILVSRRGQLITLKISSERVLGFSQNEAAQPILPGAISPHRNRNKPCTACHIIMRTGGQLPTDAGDILPNPPPITKNSVAPHSYRGKCKTCHVILKK